MKANKIAALLAAVGAVAPAFATNGMNMEGYGPVATGMGGASFAYDNGTAGLINNPATLALIPSGTARLDVAVGGLHPDVSSSMPGMPAADSGGNAYYMPAIGYVRKSGKLVYGAGMMAQGGMGTEYGSNALLSNGYSMMNAPMASGQDNRSELGIGRVMIPLAYDVSDSFSIGGTLDYLWGGLDIQMVMSGQMFNAFAMGATPLGSATGAMVNNLPSVMGAFQISDVNWAQFDFSEGGNKMKQRLTTTGWAGNIGFLWKAAPGLSVGGVYHAKTSLSDMEGHGTLKMNAVTPMGAMTVPITGTLKVVDFQWPETYGIGVAYQVNPQLLLAADYKHIGWGDVMKNFTMSFTADTVQSDAAAQGMVGLGANAMDATLVQNWKDQDVLMIGAAYKVSPALTLRAGANFAGNPIPDEYMNPLFPATMKEHYTFGVGYAFSQVASIDFAFTYAPEVSATNTNMCMAAGVCLTTTHSQTNWQLMYSQRF
jgi:long-chain fatty acid transport protein